jgi:hypothetical protein
MRITGEHLKKSLWRAMKAKGVSLQIRWKVYCEVSFPQYPTLLGESTKVQKGEKKGVLTAVLYLAASTLSKPFGGMDLCPAASAGCRRACLRNWSFRLRTEQGVNAQLWKTLVYLYLPEYFRSMLKRELKALQERARASGFEPAVRLNGTSDIYWERVWPQLFTLFPRIQFYDYTKALERLQAPFMPVNYHLTFSRTESNEEECYEALSRGFNVAIVFEDLEEALANGYKGLQVINGDVDDIRFFDPEGCIVGLSIKGNARDDSGFIVRNRGKV